jgi:hypothetical protein
MTDLVKRAFLNDRLECPKCGTITLQIPDDVQQDSPISCSRCSTYLGTWEELQDNFEKQNDAGAYELRKGRIKRLKVGGWASRAWQRLRWKK